MDAAERRSGLDPVNDKDPIIPKAPAAGACAINEPLLGELKKLQRGEALLLTDTTGRIYVVMNWDDIQPHLKGGGRPN
jgi:hypothetical protein